MSVASEVTRRHNITCFQCYDLCWNLKCHFLVGETLVSRWFSTVSTGWVTLFCWKNFLHSTGFNRSFILLCSGDWNGWDTQRRWFFSCWTYSSWLCTCGFYRVSTILFFSSLFYYARGNKKEASYFKIIGIFHTEPWFGFKAISLV